MTKLLLGAAIGVVGTALIGANIAQGVAGEVFSLACNSDTKSTQLSAACGAAQAKEGLDKASQQFSQFVDKNKKTP